MLYCFTLLGFILSYSIQVHFSLYDCLCPTLYYTNLSYYYLVIHYVLMFQVTLNNNHHYSVILCDHITVYIILVYTVRVDGIILFYTYCSLPETVLVWCAELNGSCINICIIFFIGISFLINLYVFRCLCGCNTNIYPLGINVCASYLICHY